MTARGAVDDVAAVVEEHAGYLLGGALGFTRSLADAEDLVQETLITFLRVRGRYNGRSSVRTFLYGILYRKALERNRKLRRQPPADPIDAVFERRFTGSFGQWCSPPKGPEDEALNDELAGLISGCLGELPALQRAAFHLKEVAGESVATACNALGVTDIHLRVLLFRARNRLRECLEAKWELRR